MASQGDRTARVHGGQSNRKRATDRSASKPVFKSVLANPFDIKWPAVAPPVQNAVLARTLEIVQGAAAASARARRGQSGERGQQQRGAAKKARKGANAAPAPAPAPQQDSGEGEGARAGPSSAPAPPACAPDAPQPQQQRLTVGINAVTRRLEAQCARARQAFCTAPDVPPPPPLRAVLVCRADVDPPLLVAHIPHLVAACNSNSSRNSSTPPGESLKLLALPRGAESALAQALGLRRVAALALDEAQTNDAVLSPLLASVPPVVAPWLVGFADQRANLAKAGLVPRRRLEPTHIKQLRTTAPRDMRAAKAQRARGRAEAKAKRRAREGAKKKVKDAGAGNTSAA